MSVASQKKKAENSFFMTVEDFFKIFSGGFIYEAEK